MNQQLPRQSTSWRGKGEHRRQMTNPKRRANLKKKHLLEFGRSYGVPRFVLGSSLVFGAEHIYKVQGEGILIKSTLG